MAAPAAPPGSAAARGGLALWRGATSYGVAVSILSADDWAGRADASVNTSTGRGTSRDMARGRDTSRDVPRGGRSESAAADEACRSACAPPGTVPPPEAARSGSLAVGSRAVPAAVLAGSLTATPSPTREVSRRSTAEASTTATRDS
eukprot:scaffold14790_cov138-Isochrysis_galbana.AAC.4